MGIPVRAATGALAWLGAVALATGVGLTAVNVIGVGIIGPGPQVLSPADVDARLAAAPAPATPSAAAPPTAAPVTAAPPTSVAPVPPTAAPEVLNSPGGTVVAECLDGAVHIITTSPFQGWGIHDPRDEDRGRVRFESGNSRVELRLSCVDGHPVSDTRVD